METMNVRSDFGVEPKGFQLSVNTVDKEQKGVRYAKSVIHEFTFNKKPFKL